MDYNTLFKLAIITLAVSFISLILSIRNSLKISRFSDTGKEDADEPEAQIVETESGNMEEDEELIAVIAGALAAAMGRPPSSLIVRSIKRVDNNTPAWTYAGHQDQINSRF